LMGFVAESELQNLPTEISRFSLPTPQISPWPASRVCTDDARLAPFSVPPYLSTTGNRP
jgi:hypothetical protein